MEHNCERHTFEVAEGVCRSCNGTFCADCLLYPFGSGEPPYCKPCAITAGGIRSTAANPRRILAGEQTTRKRSGGLLGRLRRSPDPADSDVDEGLTPAEILEREAEEARRMLDAQRLPAESEEEPEVELPPLPNIAPPAVSDEEPELTHRTVPEEVTGGLNLHAEDNDPPSSTTPDEDTTPDWARPEAASADALPHQADPTLDGTDAPTSFPHRADPTPAGPLDAGAVGAPAPLRGDDVESPVADDHSEHERVATTATAAETLTADGTPLFASSVPGPAEQPKKQAVPEAPPERPVPVTSAVGAEDAPATGADDAGDTSELLRRIEQLRGR